MFLIPIHILATTLMVIFEENFLSQITLKVVKIADIKFIFNMLSNICHNLMIYILSPCFLPTVQLQLQHPLLVYQTELETCQRCQLGEKSAERGATDLDLGKLLFTYSTHEASSTSDGVLSAPVILNQMSMCNYRGWGGQ